MTKSELIDAVARRTQITKSRAELVVNCVFDSMTAALERGEGIEIRGFGSFTVREYKPYSGRNPRTGRAVPVPEKRLPFFKVGKELKELVRRRTRKATRKARTTARRRTARRRPTRAERVHHCRRQHGPKLAPNAPERESEPTVFQYLWCQRARPVQLREQRVGRRQAVRQQALERLLEAGLAAPRILRSSL